MARVDLASVWWLLLCLLSQIIIRSSSSVALSPQQPTSSSSISSSSSSIIWTATPLLDVIRRGGVCVMPDWISPNEIAALRSSIIDLRDQGAFCPSGLSNRVLGDTNQFGSTDRWTCTIDDDNNGDNSNNKLGLVDREARRPVEEKLEELRQTLQLQQSTLLQLLLQPKLELELELAEQYYSISPPASCLPRHMDERHEDTKGDKGWEHETRRSISWILYLNNYTTADIDTNDDDNKKIIDHRKTIYNTETMSGGELRLYCRKTQDWCGANDGDLQVGWLPSSAFSSTSCSSSSNRSNEFTPVFLDGWKKTSSGGNDDGDSDDEWVPRSALYRLDSQRQRDYLSESFGADSPSWPSECNLEPHQFAAALALQLTSKQHQTLFAGVEDHNLVVGTEIVDVKPIGGTLVLFDSVVLPHEVLPTKHGERIAMAGWFHEPVQEFPDWYG